MNSRRIFTTVLTVAFMLTYVAVPDLFVGPIDDIIVLLVGSIFGGKQLLT